jgi:hypothetical protein
MHPHTRPNRGWQKRSDRRRALIRKIDRHLSAQEARLFELRATTQLASVLARQGRAREGEPRLRAIIDAFDTKYEIVDLAAARKVLGTLRQ